VLTTHATFAVPDIEEPLPVAEVGEVEHGLARLVKYGAKADHIMVYILCGYWPGETSAVLKLGKNARARWVDPLAKTASLSINQQQVGLDFERVSFGTIA